MTQQEAKQENKTLKVLGIIGNVFMWVFLAFAILTTTLVVIAQNNKDGIPSIFGKSLITIETNSMDPTYEVGDMVFMEKLTDEEKKELKVGDIITFRSPVDINKDGRVGDINTHRIVDISDGFIMTKGDNPIAPMDSEPIGYSEVIGKCTEKGKIGGLGGVLGFLRSSLGFFICIVVPMLIFFIYELYNFISLLVARKAAKEPISAETEEEIKRKAIEEYLAQQALNQPTAQAEEKVEDEQAPETETVENNQDNTNA